VSSRTRKRSDASANRVADDFFWTLQDRLLDPQLSERGNAVWLAQLAWFARRARRLKTSRMTRQGRITHELLLDAIDTQQRHVLEGHMEEELNSMDSLMLSVWMWSQVTPRETVRDWRAIIKRLSRCDRFVEEYVTMLRGGMAAGHIRPFEVVQSCIETLGKLGSTSVNRNPLLALTAELEETLARRKQLPKLRRQLRDALHRVALPAHRRLRSFLRRTYLPRAPRRPGDRGRYLHYLRIHLGSDYQPESLMIGAHREVERLHRQLERTARRLDPGMTSLSSFMRALNRRKDSSYASADEVMDDAVEEVLIAREQARSMVAVPLDELTVCPVPVTREAIMEAAYIKTGPTSGEFQVNTGPLLDKNKRYEMATLATHEVYPGHHLQGIYAQRQAGLPAFRCSAALLVYEEGWAMYTEQWRDARGWYTPYERIGYLLQAIRGAAMAVVDAGLNSGLMTQRRAQEYLAKTIFGSPASMKARVERVLNWPGQGVTYHVGKREILRARNEARRILGRHFDERAFHVKILSLGSVPPKILRREVAAWARRSLGRRRGRVGE
jgi:uncharacterized protein (DUF885 family)